MDPTLTLTHHHQAVLLPFWLPRRRSSEQAAQQCQRHLHSSLQWPVARHLHHLRQVGREDRHRRHLHQVAEDLHHPQE